MVSLIRLLIPTGLHHALNSVFWFDVAGINDIGNFLAGQQALDTGKAIVGQTGMYQAGFFPVMMFGLPAACYAMYRAIPKQNRKKNGGLYFSGGLTSFLTGITEPVEYMFLFVAPWLYIIHAFLDGLSFYFADILNIRVGNSFSGGLIDFLLFGVLQGNDKTNWLKLIPFGIAWAIVYFCVFTFFIKKFKVAIPGMGEELPTTTENKLNKKHH